MTTLNETRQTTSIRQFACFCIMILFSTGADLSAQEEASAEEQLRRRIPSATAIDRKVFENIGRSSKTPKREDFKSLSLTAELMFLNRKTAQDSEGQFRFLPEERMPKPVEFAQEMYRSVGIGRFRIVTHPVTMIQAERITKLEADVDGNSATGSFEFHVPELYEGKAEFTAEKTGGEWRFTCFEMPKLEIDIRSDESGRWWRAEDWEGFEPPKCLTGHTDTVWNVDFTKDGQRLVSGSSDHSVRVWDVERRKEVLTIPQAHVAKPGSSLEGWVLSVCFSPDDKWMASSSDDGLVKLWDVSMGELERVIEVKNIVSDVFFSPDGRIILSSSGALDIWNAKTGELKMTIRGHSFPSTAVSPDGLKIVTGGADYRREDPEDDRKTVKLWDAKSGELLATSENHHDILITDIAFSPDGKQIASCARDQTIKIWDAANLRLIKTIQGHEEALQSLDWSPNGRCIVGGDLGGAVEVWDVETGSLQDSLPTHPNGIRCVMFSPDGDQIATAGHDGVIRLWTVNLLSAAE